MPARTSKKPRAKAVPGSKSELADVVRDAAAETSAASVADTRFWHRLYLLGGKISDFFANLAGHPAAIIALIAACLVWLALKGSAGQNLLTLMLSILAITLTQMVLNQQRRNELALHLKIDELITALDGARNELAGIESADEDTLLAARRSASAGE